MAAIQITPTLPTHTHMQATHTHTHTQVCVRGYKRFRPWPLLKTNKNTHTSILQLNRDTGGEKKTHTQETITNKQQGRVCVCVRYLLKGRVCLPLPPALIHPRASHALAADCGNEAYREKNVYSSYATQISQENRGETQEGERGKVNE